MTDEELWQQIRAERNALLTASDWTQLHDIRDKINHSEWSEYRQKLRDITSTYLNPQDVVFPEPPSTN